MRPGDFNKTVGTNFRAGTCVRIWARAAGWQFGGAYYAIVAYFNGSYRH